MVLDNIKTDPKKHIPVKNIPQPVRLIVGLIYGNEDIRKRAIGELVLVYGEIRSQSVASPFIHTSYYRKEMGENLIRQFISFKRLIDSDSLAGIKIFTNKVESWLADTETGNRRVNIDPGYLALEKVVLATTKNYSHRIHLSKGIYADLAYRFINKSYTVLEWTYPDYMWDDTIKLFNDWRDGYIEDMNSL